MREELMTPSAPLSTKRIVCSELRRIDDENTAVK